MAGPATRSFIVALALLTGSADARPVPDPADRSVHLTALEAWQPPGTETFRRALHLLAYGSEGDRAAIAADLVAPAVVLHPVEHAFLSGRMAFAEGRLQSAAAGLERAARDERFRAEHVEVDYYLGMARHELGDPAAGDCLRAYLKAAPEGADPGLARNARSALKVMSRAAPGSNIVWGGLPRVDAGPPGWSLRSASGETTLDEMPGAVVLLHFWASWCGPCTRELPELVAFTRSPEFAPLRERGLVPVLVTADNFLGEGQDFLRSLGLAGSAPGLYHDPDSRLLVALRGQRGLPATVAVARRGLRVLDEVSGPVDWSSAETHAWLAGLVDRVPARESEATAGSGQEGEAP